MIQNYDIISIDAKIKTLFKENKEKISDFKDELSEIIATLNNIINIQTEKKNVEMLQNYQKILEEKIKDLENNTTFNFYLVDTMDIILKYKDIINTPIKTSFFNKKISNENFQLLQERESLTKLYFNVINKYNFSNIYSDFFEMLMIQVQDNNIKCINCNNTQNFEELDNTQYVCLECYAIFMVYKNTSSFNDSERINIPSKYLYDRKVHFKECIKQYQGKQNCTIEEKVYNELEKQFENYYLLEGDKSISRAQRFSKITKNQILMFLKKINYPKHYENVHLIYATLTGRPLNDISHLEDKLMSDFEILSELYDLRYKNIDRKNFINTQYVLCQLLYNNDYVCQKEDFVILKTIDRKQFHNEICKTLFSELGWKMKPFY